MDQLYNALYDVTIPPHTKFNNIISAHTIIKKLNEPIMYPLIDRQCWVARHQTLVVIEVVKDPSWSWEDRATRAVTSMNFKETIKADIMSATDGELYEGLVWTGERPGGIASAELQALAQAWGYVQCLLHHCVKR